MDSVLSGYSQSYSGTQIGQGQGYAGTVGTTGGAASGSAQGVDVTQLQPGDTFQGEIVSVNGEDVQIQLANGQYMAAKLERDVQLALGQVMNLQVQSNKDNRVVLKPIYDGKMQMLRVGEAALRAAHMAVNDRTMTLVSTLLENGMSINKNTLMLFNRLTLQNPNANMADLIKLSKLQLPINDNTLSQFQNYQKSEHKLLDGIREASDEILKLYDTLTGKIEVLNSQNLSGNGMANAAQGAVAGQTASAVIGQTASAVIGQTASAVIGQTALENGGKFLEQVLLLLAGEEEQNAGAQNTAATNNSTDAALLQENQNTQTSDSVQSNPEQTVQNNVKDLAETLNHTTDKTIPQDTEQVFKHTFFEQLKKEPLQTVPNKIILFLREGIKEGNLTLKDVKQLLLDSEIGRQLTTEQKSEIFHSEPFRSMLKNGLQKQWTLSPQDLAQEGKVEEFYHKLAKESSQLTRMMNEAMQSANQGNSSTPARAMTNLNENIAFMNQMNQMFTYVQLPLKLGNSQAHGDLYVYTNKKNMARKDGMLTAFLHLDMDHLGALDVSISLQTERNQVTTKFYLDETSIALVEGHIEELSQRLLKKGYQCKNLILEKDEDKTVLEHMEEQVAGGSTVLSYQTFDTRA